ncbi:MAG: class I SAM-dependent methyltransferase [Candidatus Theseobacter exili]|nr:class I SAM-dependent methyltransferase [Candidatus Theseobacter exili]
MTNNLIRYKSILTGQPNLERLYELKKFPVFIGCSESPQNNDLFEDMKWDICRDSGIIQLHNLIQLNIIYSGYHSEAIGGIWSKHLEAFLCFLSEFRPNKILEIGGSNGTLALQYTKENKSAKWTIIEPNPAFKGNAEINVVSGFFGESEGLITNFNDTDTIVHSHTLEHSYDPGKFIKSISSFLKIGGKSIFSVPNLYQYLKNRFINTINFEHTCFLTEPFIDYLLQRNQLKIIKKRYFEEHSVFYAVEKVNCLKIPELPNKHSEYKTLYLDCMLFYDEEVNRLNSLIDEFNGDIFLFGAHVFSQFLIYKGLRSKKIAKVIDNSKLKTGKRLYGTNLFVELPEITVGKKNIAVILKAGAYQEEVKKQLLEINPAIKIWE